MVGSITAIYLVEIEGHTLPQAAEKLLMVCVLGISLFLALSTLAERWSGKNALVRWLPLLGVPLLAAYFLNLPSGVQWPVEYFVRFALVLLACHFLVALLPFLGRSDRTGFWQYNKTLFLRILLAHLYFEVLFAGLCLALAAIHFLFNVEIDGKRYAQLGMLLAGVFQTWVFLAGVPENLEELNKREEYPSGLKVFTQFVLLPLVTLYFGILIVYEAKILITWNWPQGWVGHLVLWYSVVGILSLLLLHPLQSREGNRWIAAFGTWFFRGLVPLVVMLYFAIFQRIDEYGVTVNRMLVVNMAVGLTLVVLYFVLGRSRDIRAFPLVLCVLALVSAFGPMSAFAVGERSQRHRLADYMSTYGMLENDQIKAASVQPSDDDRREMSSIIDYLLEWHGPDAFRGWLDDDLLGRMATTEAGSWRDTVASRMGFVYQSAWRSVEGRSHFFLSADLQRQEPLELEGWTYLVDYSFGGAHDSLRTYVLGTDSCYVTFDSVGLALTVAVGTDRLGATRTSTLELSDKIREIEAASGDAPLNPALLVFPVESGSVLCRWHFEQISGSRQDDQLSVTYLRARILIGDSSQSTQ